MKNVIFICFLGLFLIGCDKEYYFKIEGTNGIKVEIVCQDSFGITGPYEVTIPHVIGLMNDNNNNFILRAKKLGQKGILKARLIEKTNFLIIFQDEDTLKECVTDTINNVCYIEYI